MESYISVDPQSITFPELPLPGETDATEVITISNTGDGTFEVNELYLDDGTDPFTLTTIDSPSVEPISTSEFLVILTLPSSCVMTGSVFISFNDPINRLWKFLYLEQASFPSSWIANSNPIFPYLKSRYDAIWIHHKTSGVLDC